jgi:hypothetical protein
LVENRPKLALSALSTGAIASFAVGGMAAGLGPMYQAGLAVMGA